jgi:hypothetical protein
MIHINIETSIETIEYHLYPPSKALLKGFGPTKESDKQLIEEDTQSLHFLYILAEGKSKVQLGRLIDRLEIGNDT